MRTDFIDDNPTMYSNMGNKERIPSEISAVKEIFINRRPSPHVAFESSRVTHPNCLPVQPSVAMDSSMPRVPTKAVVIAVDDNGADEKSFDDRVETISQHLVTTSEQFEDIPRRRQTKPDHAPLFKVGARHSKNSLPLPFLFPARFDGVR